MLVEKPYKPERVRKLLVLRMLGVNQTPDLRGFFGVRPPVIESPVFDSIHKIQEAERDRFIIGHRSDYPRIDKLFGELEVAYGWKPDAIFNPGQTPRLKLHMRNVYTMEQCLLYLTRALSGSATQQELMRSGPTRGMLWRKVKSRFQPDIVALVEERIKRGRKQKL